MSDLLQRAAASRYPLVNDRNHGPIIIVTAAFCITLSLLIFLTRLLTRWPWRSLFGWDDATTTLATLLATIQSILVIHAVDKDYGRHNSDLTPGAITAVEKILFSSDILFVLAVFTSKLAVALFLNRLSSSPRHRTISYGLAGLCGVLGVASVLVTAIRPEYPHPWIVTPDLAITTMNRWVAYAIMSNFLDVLIVGFSAYLVWDLQMSSTKKTTVVSGFVVRLILLPISILRLLALSSALHNTDFLFASIEAATWTQIEQCYAILSATIPCLRIFLSAAQTGLLHLEATSGGGGGSYYANGSFSQPLSRSRDKERRSRIQANGYGGLAGSAGVSGRGGSRQSIELATRQHGETSARVVGMGSKNGMREEEKGSDDRGSIASDSSERAIVVRQTVDVRVQNLDGSSVRSLGKGWRGLGR